MNIIIQGPNGTRKVPTDNRGIARFRLAEGERVVGSDLRRLDFKKCSSCQELGVYEYT